MLSTEERVDRLETVFARFMERTEEAMADIRASTAEIRASNLRTDALLLDMQRQADRDRHQVEEDRRKADQGWEEFRRQAEADRRKADQDRKDFNKRMAELSDSMGTLVEDMVAPNARRIAGEIFPVDPVVRLVQRLRQVHPTDPSRMVEIDLLAAGRQHLMVVDIDTDPPTDPALFSFTPEPGMVVDEQKWLPDGAGGVSVQKTLHRSAPVTTRWHRRVNRGLTDRKVCVAVGGREASGKR